MVGSLPASIKDLDPAGQLTFVDWGTNKLEGAIPESLGEIRNLRVALLFGNAFTSMPASLTRLSNLDQLQVGANQLQGTLPPTLAQNTKLTQLVLFDNKLVRARGAACAFFSILTSLLTPASQTGTISPSMLTAWPLLREFDINHNGISGTIPPEISSLSTLSYLNLKNNKMQGTVPAGITTIPYLRTIYLKDSGLCGPVPGLVQPLDGPLPDCPPGVGGKGEV